MSLIANAVSGNPDSKYFIQNIGGNGAVSSGEPCIKGGFLSGIPAVSDTVVRIGNPVSGLVLTGGGGSVIPLVRGINGGTATTVGGEAVYLGASELSFQNIVLTDNVTTVNTPLVLSGATSNLAIGGNLVFSNGATGKSISGYYSASVAFAGGGAVANPAGLTSGLYSVIVVGSGPGEEEAQASAICYYDGADWTGNGVSFNFTGGVPNVAIGPVAGGATLNIGGAGIPAAGSVVFRKLMN